MIGLPLWVKYKEKAYMYYVLSPPCNRDLSFEILLEGINCKVHLDSGDVWVETHQNCDVTFDKEIIQLIGKAINGHFHIKKHNFKN